MSKYCVSVTLPASHTRYSEPAALSCSNAQQTESSSSLEERMPLSFLTTILFPGGRHNCFLLTRRVLCGVYTHSPAETFLEVTLLVELTLTRQTPFLWSLHLCPGTCSDTQTPLLRRALPASFFHKEAQGLLHAGLLRGSGIEKEKQQRLWG